MNDQTGVSRRDVLKLAGGAVLGAAVSGVSLADDWQFKLPELPYAEDALEPYIDARTMGIHHGAHHAGYTNKLNAAQWLIRVIEQRRRTMLEVMRFIVTAQREFFDKGVHHLKPLTLRQVAEHIEMAESTVSRVTNEKYVQTPGGVYPLKFFFSGGLPTVMGGDISTRGVQARIRNLVDEEDTRRPLTDQALVNLLKSEGIKIARRTVAKYRDQLGILPARMRKRV